MALENPNIQRRKKNSSLSPDITDRAPARFDVGTLEEALNKIVKAGCCIIFAIAVIVIGKEDVIFDISGIYIYM